MISLNGFKVVYKNMVLSAIALMSIHMQDNMKNDKRETIEKVKFLDVLVINTDGNIVSIYDEAWMFQFIPIITNRDADNSK